MYNYDFVYLPEAVEPPVTAFSQSCIPILPQKIFRHSGSTVRQWCPAQTSAIWMRPDLQRKGKGRWPVHCLVHIAVLRESGTVQSSNQEVVRLQYPTSISMTGTSISTPTTVARAAPDDRPNNITAVAMATSKWLEAPIMAAGAASS